MNLNINGFIYIITIPDSWDSSCIKISNTQCHLAILRDIDDINIILIDVSMTYDGLIFNNAIDIKNYIDSKWQM